MRGNGHTLSRHPAARAYLAWLLILVGAFAPAAHGQSSGSRNGNETLLDGTRPDEVAWAIPRVPHGGVPGVAFPRPLPPTDAALLRRVFLLQARGDILEADSALADVQDPLLIGTVLADRYLGRYHRSIAAELSEWLERYPDLPEASDIHA